MFFQHFGRSSLIHDGLPRCWNNKNRASLRLESICLFYSKFSSKTLLGRRVPDESLQYHSWLIRFTPNLVHSLCCEKKERCVQKSLQRVFVVNLGIFSAFQFKRFSEVYMYNILEDCIFTVEQKFQIMTWCCICESAGHSVAYSNAVFLASNLSSN